jgi:hypothetical protein
MNDLLDVAITLAAFALGIGLVQVLSRMIERNCEPDLVVDEPPDTARLTAGQTILTAGDTLLADDQMTTPPGMAGGRDQAK